MTVSPRGNYLYNVMGPYYASLAMGDQRMFLPLLKK